MAFSDAVVYEAWLRAAGRCECREVVCGHDGCCNLWLRITQRNGKGDGAWLAHPKAPDGPDTSDNCEIVCRECALKRSAK